MKGRVVRMSAQTLGAGRHGEYVPKKIAVDVRFSQYTESLEVSFPHVRVFMRAAWVVDFCSPFVQ